MACLCICFPESTLITTKHAVKPVSQLQPNDKVVTFSKTRNAKKWTRFYTFAHLEADRVEEFILLKTEIGETLAISEAHLLFLAGPNQERLIKNAGNVCIGDKLFHLNDATGTMELVPVTETTVAKFAGVYAPLTMSGDFLANGFLVACYANVDVENFEVAHAALAPLRAYCWLFRGGKNLDKIKMGRRSQTFKEGIHGYALNLMKIRDYLPGFLKRKLN